MEKVSNRKRSRAAPAANRRTREKKPKLAAQHYNWKPFPFDFIYTDTWWYEVSLNKRITIEDPGEVMAPQPVVEQKPVFSAAAAAADSMPQLENASLLLMGGAAAAGQQKRRRKTNLVVAPLLSVKRTVRLLIPSFLTRALWSRHGYTHNDILYTLQCFKPFHLWHLAISERLSLTKLAVQSSYAAKDSFVFGAKAIVIEHLRNWIATTYIAPSETNNVLTNLEGSHVPPLPVHTLPPSEFANYSAMLPPDAGNGLDIAVYSIKSPPIWRNIHVLPIEMERGTFLLMSRVMPILEYVDTFGVPECLTMTPIRVQMSNGSMYCILDESFHFVSSAPVPVPTD